MAETRIERRLAAILAVDVAGVSQLMGVDGECTLAARLPARTHRSKDCGASRPSCRRPLDLGDGEVFERPATFL